MDFELNGARVSCPEEYAEDALLWTLRDAFELSGPRLGCGQGLCGACTVHLDGVAVRSCVTPTAAARGRRITTLEGLAASVGNEDGALHPVQQAWENARVPQCGYCQNGQIMSVAALADGPGLGDPARVSQVLDSVLCRCGTQPRIAAAIAALAHDAAGDGSESSP